MTDSTNIPFPNFLGKIERGTQDDLKDAVSVTEKMDGSYFQFGWHEGEFRYRTKSTQDYECIDKMFNKVIDSLIINKDDFPNDVVFCGEYFRSPRHNKISYDFSSLCDISDGIDKNTCFLFLIESYFTRYGTKGVKSNFSLPSGMVGNCYITHVPKLLPENETSDPGRMAESKYGAIREGVVIKTSSGARFKYVSDHFKEVKHSKPRRQCDDVSSIFEPYIKGLPARVDKVIFRLKEQGIEFCKESFGKTISETVKDLIIEEKANIANDLFKFYELGFKKKANRAIIDILFEKYRGTSECSQ